MNKSITQDNQNDKQISESILAAMQKAGAATGSIRTKNLIRTTYNMDGNPVLMTGSRNAGIKDAMEDNRQNAGPEIRSVYTYAEYGFLTSASVGFGKCILFSTGAHQLG